MLVEDWQVSMSQLLLSWYFKISLFASFVVFTNIQFRAYIKDCKYWSCFKLCELEKINMIPPTIASPYYLGPRTEKHNIRTKPSKSFDYILIQQRNA